MEIAKVFWSGRSQAVRLPKGFRLQTQAVRIRRHGNSIILEPIAEDWDWLDTVSGKLDDDFVAAANEDAGPETRPAIDRLFG